MADRTRDQQRPRRPRSMSAGARRKSSPAGEESPAERSRDALGKLMEQHRVTLLGVLTVTGLLGIVGLGLCGYAWLRDPRSLTLLIVGGSVVLMAVVLLGINILNVGCSFELRKKGVRYTQRGVATEMLWSEIVDVSVDRLDDTYMGAVSVRRRSDDASSPSGLLTKTEWTVVITSDDGRQIRLTPTFLRVVSDPKKLISHLKLRSGV